MFCQVNEQEGVLISSPADGKDRGGRSSLHRQVVDNFRRCAAQIHADFTRPTRAKVNLNAYRILYDKCVKQIVILKKKEKRSKEG